MTSKKIAFMKRATWSHTNASVLEAFTKEFSDYQIETVTIRDLEYADDRTDLTLIGSRLLNWCFAMKEFRRPILSRRKKIKSCLPRTTYAFNKHKKAVAKYLASQRYAFTFQTQSMFDASIPGIPHFVYTDHCSLATLQYPGYTKRDIWPNAWINVERIIYQNARLVFTMGTNIARWLVEKYACDPNKVVCVYAGSNAKSSLPESIDMDRYSRKRILFVGTQWEPKGGPLLVEAFKTVLKAHPDAHLTIVGCSPRLDIPNCDIVGKIPVSEMSGYYTNASIFCLPTKIEAFGISYIEAFDHRLPVIGTNLGAIPEFVLDGQNGYLVESGDVEKLAQRLIELLDNPTKCKAFGERGYQIAMQRYNWEKVTANIRENIERVIRNGT